MHAYVYNYSNTLVNIESDVDIRRYETSKVYINKSKYLYNDFRQMTSLVEVDPNEIDSQTSPIIVVKTN
jgi:hypothetical protein